MSVVDSRQAAQHDGPDVEELPAEWSFIRDDERFRGRQLANAMTVDVEDYFQVSAFEGSVSRDDWSSMPSRVPANVEKILQIFGRENVKATFFTLGWVSDRFPQLIRDIASAGHEIASHGYEHSRVGTFDREQYRQDVESTRKKLEDISGTAVVGYRAPSFSIGRDTLWAHDVLAEAGYQYSSSVFPVSHDHYGLPDAPRFPFRNAKGTLLEIPLSSLPLFGRNLPCAGGGYFRLLPLAYSKWAMRRINQREQMPGVFYFHPWEIDPDQPKIDGISAKSRFRHYVNLHKFEHRLTEMLRSFHWDRMDRIFLGQS